MDSFLIVIIVIFGVALLVIGSFMTFMFFTFKKRGKSLSYRKKVKTTPIKRYMAMYNFYSTFIFTKNSIVRLHRDLTALSIYTFVEGRILTVKLFTNGLVLYICLIIVSLVLFSNPIYLLICLIFAMVMRENFLYKKIEKNRQQLLKDEIAMLSSLRQEYLRTRSVVEAYESVTKGKFIARSIKEIHDSLTAVDSQEKLEAFSASTPLPTLQTLASISHIINNRGDVLTSTGLSVFAAAIDMVADEVRMAMRRDQLQKQLFGSLEFIPIVPIIGIVPLGMVFKNMIPGTAAIYDGAMGFIFTLIILGASLLGYYTVTNACKTNTAKGDDRATIDKRLMREKKVREFVARIRPKKESVINKKYTLIRKSLTRNTLDYLYLRKTYMSLLGFIGALAIMIAYVIVGRQAIISNISGSSMTGSTTYTDKELQILETMDGQFLKNFRSKPTEDELTEYVKEQWPAAKTSIVEEQVKRLNKKYDDIHGMIFYWWMIVVAALVAVVGYNAPEYLLKQRIKILASESEEDCLQLQTTIAIMMNTNTDTLDLLEFLYKNSRVFRNVLIDCYQNYIADPFLALRIAKAKTELHEFRNMMDKLSLTVVQLTVAEAFSDLISERDHMLRMRESAQLHALNTKRAMVRPFALAPLIALIGLQFIAPICLLAFSMFSDIMSSGLLDL